MPLIAGVSALYVYLQYRRSQQWKATDLAATLLARLETDPTLSLACHSLDWGLGPLLIPEQYQRLFPREAGTGEYPGVMQHDTSIMALALEPQLNQATLDDPRGLVYRYCFIKLFNYLDSLSTLLKDGQIRKRDLGELTYWLERIHSYPYAPSSTSGTRMFQPALKAWGYSKVTTLANKLNVESYATEAASLP